MDQSIVMSARNGVYTSTNLLKKDKDVSQSLLDISNIAGMQPSMKKTRMQ